MVVPLPGALSMVHVAAEQIGALAQPEQAERVRLARRRRREAAPLSRTLTDHLGRRRSSAISTCVASACLRDVGERLLHDAENRGRVRILQLEVGRGSTSSHGMPVRCDEVLHQPFERRQSPRSSSISGRRSAEMRRVAATVPSSSSCISAACQRASRPPAASLAATDVHLERRQRLAELVVQFARDAALLLLARDLGGGAELAAIPRSSAAAPPRACTRSVMSRRITV